MCLLESFQLPHTLLPRADWGRRFAVGHDHRHPAVARRASFVPPPARQADRQFQRQRVDLGDGTFPLGLLLGGAGVALLRHAGAFDQQANHRRATAKFSEFLLRRVERDRDGVAVPLGGHG